MNTLRFTNIDIQRETEVQIYLSLPSKFLIENQSKLLPTWNVSINQVIIVLQQVRYSLEDVNKNVTQEKDWLRSNFLNFASKVISLLSDLHYLSDGFDPRTGYPILSPPGILTLSDNHLVHTLLEFPLIPYQGCSLLTHPQWGTAVYPSTIVTTASKETIESLISNI